MRTPRSRSWIALTALAALAPAALLADALVTFSSIRSGADDAGRVMLYAPTTATSGSSISHWDLRTSPLLMWPSISGLLQFHQTDLTVPLFFDLGYQEGTATFTVEYMDPPGSGFNSTAAATPVGGNPGTTLGAQRRFAFEQALLKWASHLDNPVPTKVLAVHDSFACSAAGGVLAAAGTTCLLTSENPKTSYPMALGEALSGVDFTAECDFDFDDDGDTETGDIVVYVNSGIDQGCLGAGSGYYYGQDNNVPSNRISFSNVLLHELAHGLGFSSFTNRNPASLQFGNFFIPDYPGIFDYNLLDNQTGKKWNEMSVAERKLSIVNDTHVVWDGDLVTGQSSEWAKIPSVEILFPSGAGEFGGQPAQFGAPLLGPGAVSPTGLVAIASPERACAPIANLAGKIALIERGDCPFVEKVKNAQNAGAVAAIVYNVAGADAETLVSMAGSDPTIVIPAIFLKRSNGLTLRSLVLSGPNLECQPSPTTACLLGGRFGVSVDWQTTSDSGVAQVMSFNGARAESDQSAFFYFFDNANFEMGVKMVDACAFNDSFWTFVSGLTNQAYTVTIFDTFSGQLRQYTNPLGQYPQTLGNTDGVSGFDCTPGSDLRYEPPTPTQVRAVLAAAPEDPLGRALVGELVDETDAAVAACVADADTACHLGGRFQVEVNWTTTEGSGAAQVMSFGGQRASSDQSSFWWFFNPANFEMGVKMVDACVPPFNAYWVFVSGLTNQGFTVQITDTVSGLSKPYSNPLGVYPKTIGATGAGDGFPCVP